MKAATEKPQRSAIYTRVSTENGLEQEFNSLLLNERPRRPTSRARPTKAGN